MPVRTLAGVLCMYVTLSAQINFFPTLPGAELLYRYRRSSGWVMCYDTGVVRVRVDSTRQNGDATVAWLAYERHGMIDGAVHEFDTSFSIERSADAGGIAVPYYLWPEESQAGPLAHIPLPMRDTSYTYDTCIAPGYDGTVHHTWTVDSQTVGSRHLCTFAKTRCHSSTCWEPYSVTVDSLGVLLAEAYGVVYYSQFLRTGSLSFSGEKGSMFVLDSVNTSASPFTPVRDYPRPHARAGQSACGAAKVLCVGFAGEAVLLDGALFSVAGRLLPRARPHASAAAIVAWQPHRDGR